MSVRILGAVVAALATLWFAGCSGMTAHAEDGQLLGGTAWILAELPGEALVEPGNVTLQFAEDRASGSDGCNRFSGGFQSGAQKLQFAQLVATQMACAPAVMAQASAVTRALGATRSYRIDGERLQLLAADGTTVATYRAQATGVAGTAWTITGINNGQGGVTSLVADTTVTLQFDSAGRASGTAGCNRYTASYTAERDGLKFGAAAATRMMCATPGVMEQEQAYLRALERVTTSRMEGDRLELRDAGGALMIAARRAAATP